ncbi:hypothetical protein WJX73_010628 [Symbiochloris irregularis]|uniref:Coenzyme Q-binding protein COQ10 START domain-containing protein n=1 Tax=Symbiochloris irregularis TaxID=706552 RepID=A0AAW1PLL2_9CHLO
MLTSEDSSRIFQCHCGVAGRRIVSEQPGIREIQVDPIIFVRFLWIQREVPTAMHVIEDSHDSSCLVVRNTLRHSDYLKSLDMNWEIRPTHGQSGQVTGTAVKLTHSVTPKGLPPFAHRMPGVLQMFKSKTTAAVEDVLQDMQNVITRMHAGETWDDISKASP